MLLDSVLTPQKKLNQERSEQSRAQWAATCPNQRYASLYTWTSAMARRAPAMVSGEKCQR